MTIDPLLSNEPFEKHIQGISCVHLKTLEAPRYPHRQNAKRKWGRVLKGISAYSCLYRASRCSHFPLEGNLGTNKHYKSSIKDWDKFLWPLRRWQDSHLLLINQELHFPCDKHSWRSPWKAERLLWRIFSSENTQCWNTPAEQLHPDCLTPNDVLISAELQSGQSWKLWISSGRQKARIRWQICQTGVCSRSLTGSSQSHDLSSQGDKQQIKENSQTIGGVVHVAVTLAMLSAEWDLVCGDYMLIQKALICV